MNGLCLSLYICITSTVGSSWGIERYLAVGCESILNKTNVF